MVSLAPGGEVAPPVAPDHVALLGDAWLALAGESVWSRPLDAAAWSPLKPPAGFGVMPGATGLADGRDWILVGGENSAAVRRLSRSGSGFSVTELPALPAPRSPRRAPAPPSPSPVVGSMRSAASTPRAAPPTRSLSLISPPPRRPGPLPTRSPADRSPPPPRSPTTTRFSF